MLKRCKMCKREIRHKGSVIVMENDIMHGFGLVIINADELDPDAAGDRVCGHLCLVRFFSEKAHEITGVKPLYPAGVSA